MQVDSEMNDVINLLLEHWALQKPNVLLSLTGDTESKEIEKLVAKAITQVSAVQTLT